VKRGAYDLVGVRLLGQCGRLELGAADDYQVLDLGNSSQGQPLPRKHRGGNKVSERCKR
jgi:hypothetical protein